MSPSLLQQAITFREVMDQPLNTPDENVHELQFGLIIEEYNELRVEYEDELSGS
jgi:hypothetical protein